MKEEKVTKQIHRSYPINTKRARSKRMRHALSILLDEDVSIAELAERMQMSRSTVNRWFQVDDIRLSSLEEMGKVLGYHVEWKFVKD